MQRSSFLIADLARVLAALETKSWMIFSVTGDGGGWVSGYSRSSRTRLLATPVGFTHSTSRIVAPFQFSFTQPMRTGEIAHHKRSHRKTEVAEHAVDVPRHRAFQPRPPAPRTTLRQRRLPTKRADADQRGDLADLLGGASWRC
jgi:hypothetical protein